MVRALFYLTATLLLLEGIGTYAGATASLKAVQTSVRTMNFSAVPSDADMHNRTKWSNGFYVLIDDDVNAPCFYVFDRSGRQVSSVMVQIPGSIQLRIFDFAATPNGAVWSVGSALSASGQQGYFLARISSDASSAQILNTTPFWPTQIAVAPDGTIWTVGRESTYGGNGNWKGADPNRDVLRHFDQSGKLIGSAVPYGTVSLTRAFTGYLMAAQDRIGWYSPAAGAGTYVEFSSDMKVIHSYPTPSTTRHSRAFGFTLTPSGNAFVVIAHPDEANTSPALYELDRSSGTWVPVAGVSAAPSGAFPMLEGSDAESLVFQGVPDRSKLRVFSVAGLGTP